MRTKKVDVSEDEPIILPDKTTPKTGKTESYEVKRGDTLQSIAVQFKLDWKTIAESNGIKPPYALKIGQKLKVPPLSEV